ncbi:MAG: nucleoside deaminase [Spirochaetes bacterium]|jgi:guanine deaminase|nr:nucleoside deaminase [Spirochaetota bacterium]
MNQYMRMALAEALGGMRANQGGPFGAVIVAPGGRVVGRAHNRVIATKDPTAHAEIEAIREASRALGKFDLSDCEIYASSEPCPMCLAAILWARIPRIFYGCAHEQAARAGFSDADILDAVRGEAAAQPVASEQMDEKECLIAFREWEAKPDKVPY